MYQIYSVAPSVMKLKSILHIVDTRELNQSVKDIINSYTCESHFIYKLGETNMSVHRFKEFQAIVVHDTITPYRHWDLIKKDNLVPLLKEVALSKDKLYIGVGHGAAILQYQSTYFKGYPGINATDLHTPFINVLKHRLVFHYKHTKENKIYSRQLMEASAKSAIYCFPDGTGYISKDDHIIGTPYVVKRGKWYEISEKLDNSTPVPNIY